MKAAKCRIFVEDLMEWLSTSYKELRCDKLPYQLANRKLSEFCLATVKTFTEDAIPSLIRSVDELSVSLNKVDAVINECNLPNISKIQLICSVDKELNGNYKVFIYTLNTLKAYFNSRVSSESQQVNTLYSVVVDIQCLNNPDTLYKLNQNAEDELEIYMRGWLSRWTATGSIENIGIDCTVITNTSE